MNSTVPTLSTILPYVTNATTTAMPKENKFDWRDIIIIIALCIILVIGVLGNCLVCLLFRTSRKTKLGTMESLIFLLAIVDLIASIINPSLYIYWQVTFNKKWHFGVVACKILPTIAKATVSVSLGIILIITVDRCVIIVRPFHPQPRKSVIYISVLLIVVISLIKELPNIVYLKDVPGVTCVVPDASNPKFVYPLVIMNILRDLVFLTVFVITSFLIYNELYNKEHLAALKAQKDIKKTKEVVVMLITMAVVFIILVFPRDILHTAYAISWLSPPGIPYTKFVRDINAILKILHMCNSVCNVFIYAGLHGRFRRELIYFVKKLFCRVAERRKMTLYSETSASYDDQYSAYSNKNINYVCPPTQWEENHNYRRTVTNVTTMSDISDLSLLYPIDMDEEKFHQLSETDM